MSIDMVLFLFGFVRPELFLILGGIYLLGDWFDAAIFGVMGLGALAICLDLMWTSYRRGPAPPVDPDWASQFRVRTS